MRRSNLGTVEYDGTNPQTQPRENTITMRKVGTSDLILDVIQIHRIDQLYLSGSFEQIKRHVLLRNYMS